MISFIIDIQTNKFFFLKNSPFEIGVKGSRNLVWQRCIGRRRIQCCDLKYDHVLRHALNDAHRCVVLCLEKNPLCQLC